MTETPSVFTALDRCDACGAQAWVKAQLNSGTLYFCAHHARAFADKLSGEALEIIDETDRLQAQAIRSAPLTAIR